MITFLVVTVLLLLFFGWRAIVFAVLWIVGVAIFLTVVWNLEANAQERCGDRTTAVHRLETVFGERARFRALSEDGVLLEFFAAEEGRTWTLLASDETGETCVLDMGEGWEVAKPGEPT